MRTSYSKHDAKPIAQAEDQPPAQFLHIAHSRARIYNRLDCRHNDPYSPRLPVTSRPQVVSSPGSLTR